MNPSEESSLTLPHHRDMVGARLGMWLFLFTELILFGGLFLLYGVYRIRYPADFAHSARSLDLTLGAANAAILLTGSFLTTLATVAMRRGRTRQAAALLWGTVLAGGLFLFNHYLEWSDQIHQGIFPNSPVLDKMSHGEILYFGLYYVTLGLHGLHVFIGSFLLAVIAVWTARGKITPENDILLENSGLYWHLVDIIWIFIFPLYYLLR
jgi:cytochrome c oxidase subunit 3